jgi:dTDP-4-dehydrorhamnose reductase
MNRKEIAVFGARSKSAQYLADQLELQGYQVSVYSSQPLMSYERVYDIYNSIEDLPRLNADVVVYFSWATSRDEKDQKVAAYAATRFAKHARLQNVDVIFISTLAALPRFSRSHYGNYKSEAEMAMRRYGHSILRPATVVSKSDPNFSSSMESFLQFEAMVRIFSYLTKKLLIPTVDIETFSSTLLALIGTTEPVEINLIQEVSIFENFANISPAQFHLPIPWSLISKISFRGEVLDRLLTLVTVSEWLSENRTQP